MSTNGGKKDGKKTEGLRSILEILLKELANGWYVGSFKKGLNQG